MSRSDRSLSQVRIIYIVTTVFLVVLSIYGFTQIRHLIAFSGWINHTNQVTSSLQKVYNEITTAETNQRGYMLTGDSTLLHDKDSAFYFLSRELRLLDSLISDNPEQTRNLEHLNNAVDEKSASMRKVLL